MPFKIVVNMVEVEDFFKQQNLSQAQIAKIMGVSTSLLSRVLSKQRSPSGAFIKGLVNAGMPVEKIFTQKLANGNNLK